MSKFSNRRSNVPASAPQGLSSAPQRILGAVLYTTEGEVKVGPGVFQTQILPTAMHLLRFRTEDHQEFSFVLGGQVFGYQVTLPMVETAEPAPLLVPA